MPKNRNKYRTQGTICRDLPIHLVEHIVSKCDALTMGRCAVLCKSFKDYIGDARPIYMKNQMHFLKLLEECCSNHAYKCFYFRVISKDFHMILSDENGHVVYVDITFKRCYRKPLKRSYKKTHVVPALTKLLNGTRLLQGTNDIAGDFFKSVFENISEVTMTTHTPPVSLEEWNASLHSYKKN